jgi:hypothetical protein
MPWRKILCQCHCKTRLAERNLHTSIMLSLAHAGDAPSQCQQAAIDVGCLFVSTTLPNSLTASQVNNTQHSSLRLYSKYCMRTRTLSIVHCTLLTPVVLDLSQYAFQIIVGDLDWVVVFEFHHARTLQQMDFSAR